MPMLINDRETERRLIARRRRRGQDKFDEVWNGVYVMAPMANNEHQDIVGSLQTLFEIVVKWPSLGRVQPGVVACQPGRFLFHLLQQAILDAVRGSPRDLTA